MKIEEIYGFLCYYDLRNPYNTNFENEPLPEKCFCDNCFYGRNKLALEILKLKGIKNEN